MAAGIVSTAIGIGVILLSDWSMGETLDTSIFDIIVTIGAGGAFLLAYRWILKRRMAKGKA